MIPVLYDGWELARRPDGPASLHLLALLAQMPGEVHPFVALPEEPPPWLPEGVTPIVHATPDTQGKRFSWEQSLLPRLAQKAGAQLLHLFALRAPLLGRLPCLVSPASYEAGSAHEQHYFSQAGLSRRLQSAISLGGLARIAGIFWPADLPSSPASLRSIPLHALPPMVSPAFNPSPDPIPDSRLPGSLPETYILYHGPIDSPVITRLLRAWKWAARPIGSSTPLVILGKDNEATEFVQRMLKDEGLQDTARVYSPVSPEVLPAIYKKCTALVHLSAVSPWGDPVRHALASGRPVAAIDSPWMDSIVGPAAYLVPEEDARSLGAALITIAVEEDVAELLSQAALQRTIGWNSAGFTNGLLEIYRKCMIEKRED